MRASAVSSMRQEPPALRRASVLRPRLLERLRERFAARVTVVVAPAGFGKTTLLAQAVAENRLSPRGAEFWLTCIADDVAGSSLAEGLCHGLGVTPPGGLDAAVDKIVETTWHHSPAEVALVIDDVHEIAAHSPGADVLTRLAAALPRNGHLVLSGRQPPAVPLSRLEVQGQVLHLHQHDLLFTDVELAEFYAQRHVAADDLADLARCGGWPALAELVATAGPRVEADYLWEEVLAGIVPERRRDLALLAHVGPFDDALASAVLDRATDAAELTADLPLVTSGASGRRQIHGLWRPHLARLIDEADIAEARRRAGLELARAGDVVTAVRLLGQANAWDDLTEVVADVLGAAHTPVAGDVVAGWLGRLPDRLAGGPLARLLGAVAAVQTDPRAATRDLADAADAFRAEGNVTGELACMAQAGQLAWWFEEPEQLFRLALRLFEIEALGHRRAAPLACLGRALIADTQADSEGVLAELGRIPAGSLPDNLQGLVDWLRATSLNHLGRPTEGLEAADAALAQVHQFLAPVIELTQLQSRWYLGHIDEVLERLPSVLERTATTGLRDYTALVAAACCQAFATAGRTADAARCLELVRASVAPVPAGPGGAGEPGEPGEPPAPAELPPLVAANLVVSEALTAVAAGDETTAAQVLAEHQARSGPVGAGLAAFPQHRSLTLWYLLAPDTRPVWDEAALGPCYAVARDLARALVAVRTDGRIGASPPLPAPGLVRAVLPLPWTAQLALAHVAAGRADGWALLEAVWPEAQAEVRRQADRGSGPLVRPARAALARLP
ncbi:MAG TPA: AAA family ATPase, partial [Acidimicrobiales bacterium]|nr:AAA family ATPase [Acidimicrobiales bacterium]